MITAETVKSALDYSAFYRAEVGDLKPGADGNQQAVCPFHKDSTPSLSVNLNNGLFNCFACGASGDVFAFYQKRHNVNFKEALQELARLAGVPSNGNGEGKSKARGRIVKIYDYPDETGKLTLQVCRIEPGRNNKSKDFSQRRPDGAGGWIWGLSAGEYGRRANQQDWYKVKEGQSYDATKNFPACKPILYQLPALINTETIAVCEGEKDCDALVALGFTATTNPGGASKWRKTYNKHFQGKQVVILSDNDEPGRTHAQDVARHLHGVAAVVKVVDLPGLPEKGDVSDWIKAGGTFEQLSCLVKAAIEWESPEVQEGKVQPEREQEPQRAPKQKAKADAVGPAIEQLNKKHAVVMLGGKCLILNKVKDPTFNRPDITFSAVQDFKNYYANVKVEVPTEKGSALEPLGKIWLNSPERRQYEGIVFCPGQDIPGFYNLFRGLAVKPVKGDWSLMSNHIQEVIAGGNPEHFKYLLAWMARLAQYPGGERAGVSIALRGEMGTGKGCFVSQFGEIFGPHFLHITNPAHLVHRFNNHLKDCLLCFVDEGIWAGDRAAEGVLKGMITEKHIMVEPKGKDAFAVKNHIHLIIASNSEWIVPAGFEERRFLVLDVSPKHKQDHEYFGAIFYQMDHGGREAMLHELMEMKIDVDLRKIPRTTALLDQVIHTMPTAHKFWLERLRAGTLIDEHREWDPYVITENLFQAYLNFAANYGDRYRLIDRQFTKEIKRLCPGVVRKQKVIETRDKWVLYFPELETCRKNFESIVGIRVNWDSDADASEQGLPF